ncbi:unnamed protein product [Caenorhabditis bovis]|uniref:STAS domain-containing protein n=1 Tax=Caenorhabditis bovis TaxID=2654633 RepID=A0A8S1EH67_9PELO|nr:unnamed protein product [Caenorhabditis bovis]
MSRESKLARFFRIFIPISYWLPRYNVKQNLINDVIGGLTIGFLNVPQGMAYASLAGVHPVNGLYTSLFPPLIYMLFGTSRHVAIGVFAVVSLMTGSCVVRILDEMQKAESPIEAVDIIKIIFGLLKANRLISLLSEQIIVGFTTGAAIHVFTAQLNKIVGVDLPRHEGFGKIYNMYRDLYISAIANKGCNFPTFSLSFGAIFILYMLKYKITPYFLKKLRIPVPYDLMCVVLGTYLSYRFDFHGKYNIKVIGKVPTGIPLPVVPNVTLVHRVLFDAAAIAIIVVVVTISMGKLIAKKQKYAIDTKQEFFAIGIMEICSSFFPCWPSSTALARTLVNENAGTKTQLSSIFSATVLVSVLLFIGPYMELLPTCLLSAIVIVALRGMFAQLRNLFVLWKLSKADWAIFTVTLLATVIYDVIPGLFIGTVFGMLVSILRLQKTQLEMFYACPLFYFNCEKFEKEIIESGVEFFKNSGPFRSSEEMQMIDKTDEESPALKKSLVLDMQGIPDIDVSGINSLLKVHSELFVHGIAFKLKNPNGNCIH